MYSQNILRVMNLITFNQSNDLQLDTSRVDSADDSCRAVSHGRREGRNNPFSSHT